MHDEKRCGRCNGIVPARGAPIRCAIPGCPNAEVAEVGTYVDLVKIERFGEYSIAEVEISSQTSFGRQERWREIIIWRLDPLQVRALVSAASPADLEGWPPNVLARFEASATGWRMARKAACAR